MSFTLKLIIVSIAGCGSGLLYAWLTERSGHDFDAFMVAYIGGVIVGLIAASV